MDKKKRKKRKKSTSFGHMELEKLMKSCGLKSISEYDVSGKIYDLYVPELNLLIEFNGTRWHYDNRFYSPYHYDKLKSRYVYQKWLKDHYKTIFAKDRGFNVVVIWQHDWENISNKRIYVKKLLKRYRE